MSFMSVLRRGPLWTVARYHVEKPRSGYVGGLDGRLRASAVPDRAEGHAERVRRHAGDGANAVAVPSCSKEAPMRINRPHVVLFVLALPLLFGLGYLVGRWAFGVFG